jgi:hypothetical protein
MTKKTSEKFAIFHVQGGLGKHIAATAVAKCIKNNHPDRKLIVVCVYSDIFINLPFVDRVYELGKTSYFYQTYIENKDSLIFHNEPYYTTDHILGKLPLIQTWCKMYQLKFNNETPEVLFNKLQNDISRSVWKKDKPIMILHTNGGLISPNAKPYMWARDIPLNISQDLVDRYYKDYTIYHVTKKNSPKLANTTTIQWDENMQLSTMEFLSILIHSNKRILIDSSLQHAAAALNLPSVVLWNGTSPKTFGYDLHTNIETIKPNDFKLPGSYLFDFDFTGVEYEYPYSSDEPLYDINILCKAVDQSS